MTNTLKKEDLYGTKIRVNNPEECEKIQKRLFELGFYWFQGEKTVQHTHSVALFMSTDKITKVDSDCGNFFEDHEFMEITMKDLFPEEETEFKVGDTVRITRIREDAWQIKDPEIIIGSEFIIVDISMGMYAIKTKQHLSGVYFFQGGKNMSIELVKSIIDVDHTYSKEYQGKFITEEKKMKLEDMKAKNIKKAQKQFNEEKANEEVNEAKHQLRNATDEINRLDREIRAREEAKKPYLEILAKFK